MKKHQIDSLLSKGKSQSATEEEKREMFALFSKEEEEYELKRYLLDDLHSTPYTGPVSLNLSRMFSQLWSTIENSNRRSKSTTFWLKPFLKIAAILVLGLFLGALLNSIITKMNPVYYAAHSPRGSVSELQLPDGSTIFLNSDSKIKYSVEGTDKIREVFLEGEAWFHVEKNDKKPFVVHTPFYNVKVTGTQFNVKAYPADDNVTTTLEEGQVIISPSEMQLFTGDIILKPGQQMVYNINTKILNINKVRTNWYTSWKDNKLIFVNMSFRELITVLERKYGVDIEVENNAILDYHFDGTIKNETIIEVLEIIKKTLPIRYEIIDQKIKITER